MTPADKAALLALAERSRAVYLAMSPEQREEHDLLQRKSWVRGMTARCEHGMADFEQCGDCRAKAAS